ncbi:MAG TPA: sporulation protein YabP [Bacilli bacterium]|jgi:sporulation protein YabP|nr:sporulation protein YabP [Acholeplasmataceae bacterium]OQB65089.1 MAG: Spore protein YabP [Tenericutes bacterium ADurb.Bin140]HOE77166.1 sporulation protein YabP [Bacilli bacterium]HON63271.1 sporulation protein YabP [Bacilli bacterium]HOR96133.1 sporulation protein YabP [Bacilli bacterium]
MNYEKIDGGAQELTLKERKKLEITGVKKIESLNSEQFYILTTLGDMLVRGSDLEMQHLDVDKGLLWIKGFVYSIEYVDNLKSKKEKSSLMGKLFK